MLGLPFSSYPKRLRITLVSVSVLILLTGLAAHVINSWQPIFIDEGPVLRNQLRFVQMRTLIPDHAKYPTFYYYVSLPATAVSIVVNAVTGAGESIQQTAAQLFLFERRDLALGPRLFNIAILYAAAGFVALIIARRVSPVAALFAFFLVASTPGLLTYTGYALPDVTLILLGAGNLWFLYRFQKSDDLWFFLGAVALVGLAISTKYNAAGLAVSPGIWGVAVNMRSGMLFSKLFPLHVVLALTVLIVFFLIGSPGWILAPDFFLDELRFEVEHASKGHIGAVGVPVLGQIELLLTNIPVLFLLSLPGLILAARHEGMASLIPISSIVATLALAAFSEKQSFHYLFPAIPGLSILAGHTIGVVLQRYRRPALFGFAAICLLLSAVSLTDAARLFRPNATDLAKSWILHNIPEGSRVTTEFAYVPVVYSKEHAAAVRESTLYKALGTDPLSAEPMYVVTENTYDLADLEAKHVQYLITSPRVFDRFFDHGLFTKRAPEPDHPMFKEFEQKRAFYEALFASDDWHIVYESRTGHGPDALVLQYIPEGGDVDPNGN